MSHKITPEIIIYTSTTQKMKLSINDFFSKCDQICSFLRIWSNLLKKSLMENFILCAVLCSHPFLAWNQLPTLHVKKWLENRTGYNACIASKL